MITTMITEVLFADSSHCCEMSKSIYESNKNREVSLYITSHKAPVAVTTYRITSIIYTVM